MWREKVVEIAKLAKDAKQHGSGGGQGPQEMAGKRVADAEARDEILSAEASGWLPGTPFFANQQRCHEFAETHEAWVKATGETLAVRRTIGELVKMLRSKVAGGHVWDVIHNRSGLTTFDTSGFNVQIVNKGASQPAPFAGASKRLAETSAAEQLRDAHARLALTLSERDPTYCLNFVDADGNVTETSGLLDRATCLEALRKGGFGADPGSLLWNARQHGISSLTVGDASVIVTRVVGSSGNDVDVVAVTDDNGRHIVFINLIPQAQRSDMRPRFCAFLTPEGFATLKLESADKAKGKPGWLPRGWHICEGVDLLCTGVKASKAEVDDITGFFKGKEGCASHASVTGNANKSGSGIAGCRYFEAHYYACDGKTQPTKTTGGLKVAK